MRAHVPTWPAVVLCLSCADGVSIDEPHDATEPAGDAFADAEPSDRDAALVELPGEDGFAPEDAEMSSSNRDAAGPFDAGPGESSALALARDRLLDTMAAASALTRCEQWTQMTQTERGVFLTISDLLGRRSLFEDGTPAIDHVLGLWAVRGARTDGCLRCCGGGEFHRLYLSADERLITAFRTLGSAVTPWKLSTDSAGPHEPFDQSAMTEGGLPEGQSHYFSSDEMAVELQRPGVEGVFDPRAVEIDIDYNLIHDSSPDCSYGGQSGLELYESSFSGRGLGGSAELDYRPTGC